MRIPNRVGAVKAAGLDGRQLTAGGHRRSKQHSVVSIQGAEAEILPLRCAQGFGSRSAQNDNARGGEILPLRSE
jgi:hypothetical protein